MEDLKWLAEQLLCDKTTLPSHHDNRQWMHQEMEKIKSGDYTILDFTGLKEAYEEASNKCLPGVQYELCGSNACDCNILRS